MAARELSPSLTDTPLTLRLDEVGNGDTDIVGGKCAGLGELLRAGIRVPPGFAVTTEAFRRHLLENGLSANDLGPEAVRVGIEEAPMSAALSGRIRDAYATLEELTGSAPAVAVRSSGVGEDSRAASFAGQQETYLWITGADDVIAHVRRCWASLYSAQAVSYRKHLGTDVVPAIGVGVQLMVDARVAGVMFTLDPVTGDRSQIAVNSAWGLGLAVANGEVTPDEFLVDRVVMEVTRRRITTKPFEYLPDGAHGVHQQPVPAERGSMSSLTDAELMELASVGKRIESHMGSPQDIEWGIDRRLGFPESLFILQSRPATVWANKVAPKPPPPQPGSGISTLAAMMQDMLRRPSGADLGGAPDTDRAPSN
jgi:pyruvate, water dikinase